MQSNAVGGYQLTTDWLHSGAADQQKSSRKAAFGIST